MSVVLGYDESPGSRPALAMAVSLAARFDEPLVLVCKLLQVSDRPVLCVPAGKADE